jgi:hypothetical protein
MSPRKHRRARAVLWLFLAALLSSVVLPIAQASAEPNWMVGPKPELPAELLAKAEKTLTLKTPKANSKPKRKCIALKRVL